MHTCCHQEAIHIIHLNKANKHAHKNMDTYQDFRVLFQHNHTINLRVPAPGAALKPNYCRSCVDLKPCCYIANARIPQMNLHLICTKSTNVTAQENHLLESPGIGSAKDDLSKIQLSKIPETACNSRIPNDARCKQSWLLRGLNSWIHPLISGTSLCSKLAQLKPHAGVHTHSVLMQVA